LSRFVASYRTGLKVFQQKEPQFLEMNAAQQIEVLQKLERDPFFEMLVDHTMQGFYGSPEHGGNLDEASWKMMGIEKYMGGGHWHGA
jgi:gluconate 2-dehydrogenase gamma chain